MQRPGPNPSEEQFATSYGSSNAKCTSARLLHGSGKPRLPRVADGGGPTVSVPLLRRRYKNIKNHKIAAGLAHAGLDFFRELWWETCRTIPLSFRPGGPDGYESPREESYER